jgi:hypothetical protein
MRLPLKPGFTENDAHRSQAESINGSWSAPIINIQAKNEKLSARLGVRLGAPCIHCAGRRGESLPVSSVD